MKRLFLMHGKEYDGRDPKGYLMSEKLDGGRAIWIPSTRGKYVDFSNDTVLPTGLWSRDGKVIQAPSWWIKDLPNIPLDGELYLGRGRFQDTMSIVRCNIPDQRWDYIKLKVFDMPTHFKGGIVEFKNTGKVIQKRKLHTFEREYPFSDIYKYLQKNLVDNIHVELVKQIECTGKDHLDLFLGEVLDQNGEGVMLRYPHLPWQPYRCDTIMKVKAQKYAEVVVEGFYYGEGKYNNMMGSLLVSWEGKLFKVSGFTNKERWVEEPGRPFEKGSCRFYFHVGDTIRIKYRELSDDGIPKEARYDR